MLTDRFNEMKPHTLLQLPFDVTYTKTPLTKTQLKTTLHLFSPTSAMYLKLLLAYPMLF